MRQDTLPSLSQLPEGMQTASGGYFDGKLGGSRELTEAPQANLVS